MEFEVPDNGDTTNFWRYKLERVGNKSFATVYVSREDHPTRPTSVKVMVE